MGRIDGDGKGATLTDRQHKNRTEGFPFASKYRGRNMAIVHLGDLDSQDRVQQLIKVNRGY